MANTNYAGIIYDTHTKCIVGIFNDIEVLNTELKKLELENIDRIEKYIDNLITERIVNKDKKDYNIYEIQSLIIDKTHLRRICIQGNYDCAMLKGKSCLRYTKYICEANKLHTFIL